MRLVLGLVALATAISGAAGTGHTLNNGPSKNEANPTNVQQMGENVFIQEKRDRYIIGDDLSPKENASNTYYTLNEKTGDNDSPATAQDFGSIISNSWDFTHYSSSGSPTLKSIGITGNIAQDHGQDWYKFTIYGKADFTIDLTNIPNQCDYDLSLYKNSNGRFAATDYEVTNIASSAYGSNHDEQISRRLLPGVYYIKVYSYNGFGSPTYNLSVYGNYVREDVCIEEMMAKGANAALWYSDYDPFGIKPSFTDLSTLGVGQIYSRTIIHRDDYDHYHPEFPHVLDQQYKQAELFVWGREYRNKLYNFVGRALEQAEDEYINAVNLYVATKKVGNIVTIVIGTLGAVASVISLGSSTAATIAGVVSLSLSIGSLAYEAVSILFPSGVSFQDYQRFIDYLGDLHAALECNAFTSDTEVVRIPIRYALKETKSNGPISTPTSPSYIYDWYNQTTYSISYAPAERQWSYLYDDGGKVPGQNRYIHAIDHEGDTPFTGTIYPIFDDESATKAWNRQTYDMSYSTMSVNGQYTLSLNSGGYKWFKFTAPSYAVYRFLSEGDAQTTLDVFDGMVYGKSEYLMKKRAYQNNGLMSGVLYAVVLQEGQTIYLRVSGGNGDYNALSSTKIRVYKGTQDRIMEVYAEELNLPMNWQDPLPAPSQYLINKGVRVVALENARLNEDWLLELEADCHDEFFRSSVTIRFDRPIKRISLDAAYGTWWRYSRNPLIINGLNSSGQTVITYWEDTMDYDFFQNYHTYSYLLKDPSQGVYQDIYSVQFMLDPYQTQDSYHNSYEMVHIGMFTVEFAD